MESSASEPTYTLPEVMSAVSQALAVVFANLTKPLPVATPKPGPMDYPERMRRHALVLGGLEKAGGSLPQADFLALVREAGYEAQGYGGFYAKKKGKHLCEQANGIITIAAKGKARLAYAKDYLGLQ